MLDPNPSRYPAYTRKGKPTHRPVHHSTARRHCNRKLKCSTKHNSKRQFQAPDDLPSCLLSGYADYTYGLLRIAEKSRPGYQVDCYRSGEDQFHRYMSWPLNERHVCMHGVRVVSTRLSQRKERAGINKIPPCHLSIARLHPLLSYRIVSTDYKGNWSRSRSRSRMMEWEIGDGGAVRAGRDIGGV